MCNVVSCCVCRACVFCGCGFVDAPCVSRYLTSRASSGGPKPFMDRGAVSWGLIFGSHLARSFLDGTQRDSLETEIAGLRVEVFRARELVTGFNSVLEACERSNSWLRSVNQVVLSVIAFTLITGLVLVCIARFQRFGLVIKEEPGVPVPLPVSDLTQSPSGRTGPGRPSDRLRARDERA